ncbi:HEPN domain-containing protein [Hydrobacter penzbergensis]|jgi:HEPN domain-containing protein|uniref:HEPN domain-containing protein n=1 Tax=Hydrobacter penzbergensis TaxID=1235997 RepID=A0A8X8I8U3_9BACT|nr:HEPN domain-containing protein [Hydrobacter penzbergensis]MBN8718305.1 HEPN domain-containing protein [Sediminibacterium magnilacihabitans]PQV62230.1 HEPN domain-containing protein [Sediminibacterium magnilacihabitans]SDW10835.1 HEPN domain-containing protein [Hydrobacter penzbergensis]
MTEAEVTHLNQWIEKAEHDLIAAQLIIEHQPMILDVACFHCQQAVEKYLKAFLIFKKEEFPRTHNLDLLIQSCSVHQEAFTVIDLKNLEDFAVRGRYPHDFLRPELEETQFFYKITLEIKDLVIKELNKSIS